jgi:hypothetical protein
MLKYNTETFVVQDKRLFEASIQKLGCCRSECRFLSTLLQEILKNLFGFSFGVKLFKAKRESMSKI